ncbi:MAG: hypothetical protein RLZ71_820 [Actinomycetota bacterium]|jgi:signal transduction histidine kinase
MIQWIRENKWLPTVFLGSALFLILGGIDVSIYGYAALIPAFVYSSATVVARALPWLSIVFITGAEAAQVLLGFPPLASSITLAVTLFVAAAFAEVTLRRWLLVSTIALASVVAYLFGYGPYATFDSVGISLTDSFLPYAVSISAVSVAGWLILSWTLGRMAFVRFVHVGSPMDRALTLLTQARLNLELAKQNERVDIARDLTEILVQRIAAVLSLTEGGSYAVRQDPEAAARALSRATDSARAAQLELRRLYDLLHTSRIGAGVSSRISDIDALIIAYREFGFNAELRTEGEPFELDEGAELCLYKIVFESLENIRKHCPQGTSITVDFSWVPEGLQVLVKDNGIEVANRARTSLGEIVEGYDVSDDVDALVAQIDGATLGALRERAALYEGNVEATSVPGVGFTVSAIFPTLKAVMEQAL